MLDAGLATLDLLKRLLRRFRKVESVERLWNTRQSHLFTQAGPGPVVRISIGGRKA